VPSPSRDDLAVIQRSLETLFRLNASRGVHANVVDAAGVNLSQPGYTLLRRVDEDGPTPLGDLARAAHMDPAVASRQIRQLEDDGLVRRLADACANA
jgi:DNA-binding MarR family transcriptional regulator